MATLKYGTLYIVAIDFDAPTILLHEKASRKIMEAWAGLVASQLCFCEGHIQKMILHTFLRLWLP